MSNKSVIRNLVNRALLVKRLTPELENMINLEGKLKEKQDNAKLDLIKDYQ